MDPLQMVVPLSLFLGLLVWGLFARWHLAGHLAAMDRPVALSWLIWPHALRFMGLAFLVPGVTSLAIDLRFAAPAALGDLLAAVLALLALAALKQGWRAARPLLWLFNVLGTLDLVCALALGLAFVRVHHLGAAFFIPTQLVPPLLVSHALIFWLLARPR